MTAAGGMFRGAAGVNRQEEFPYIAASVNASLLVSHKRSYLPELDKLLGRFVFHFIHLVVCLMTGPKPLPKRALHIVRSRASSFK